MQCRCGETINPILGYYPDECAVCRMNRNFHDEDCKIFTSKGHCTCPFAHWLKGVGLVD